MGRLAVQDQLAGVVSRVRHEQVRVNGISANHLYGFGRFNLRTMGTRAFAALTAPVETLASGDKAAYATPYARVPA
jgi:hypothetical protein